MAAFCAVVSLEQLLNQLSNSDQLPREEAVCLHGKISSLKSSLEKIFPAPKKERDEANKLAIQIREKIFLAQDTIESFIFAQSHLSESPESQISPSISLEEIIADIDPIIAEAKELEDSISKGKRESQPVDEAPTFISISSRQSTEIVGQEKYKELIKKKLIADVGKREVIPISGMAGVGKTTLVRSIYEDDNIRDKFPFRAWVTVSQDYSVADVYSKLLNSLESRGQKAGNKVYEGTEEVLRIRLHQVLYNTKYLVVIDDMWDQEIWSKLHMSLPDNQNRSRVVITTRISNLAESVKSNYCLEMEPLDEIDSWRLLRQRIFGNDMDCPPKLENHGKGIAINCKGLPLSLIVIGGLLSQGKKETEYWRSIEEDTQAATSDATTQDSFSGILSLSYDLLPSKLKGCFLYMAAFPQDSDIPVSKLIMLWVAEGFISAPLLLMEKVAEQSLLELIERNLVVIEKKGSDGQIKCCGMHSTLRDLAEKESRKDMFFHLIKRHHPKLEQAGSNTQRQRRVSVHNNILMCLDDVYNSTKKITNARSLLYIGPHHHHPMLYNLTFDLLRVLDAFTVFFIKFPNEILKLIHLRYLAFTYNGKLPSRLSRLHKLQVLTVKRHPKYIYVGTSFLPDEIWYMKELRHLLITETDFPLLSPTDPGSILFENLQTLSNVNAASCTEEVLGNMPNLKRLKVWVEAPGKVGLYLNKLDQLEVFKLAVLDPIRGKRIEFRSKLFFPDTVRKLNLSGSGLPWDEMKVIAELPNLEVLKLKEFAFHGNEWCCCYKFRKLKFLLMEYLNLERWEAGSRTFPRLEQLIVRHCYDLEEIPSVIGELGYIQLIELVDCSPGAVASAERIKTTQEDDGIYRLQVRIYSSWDKNNE